MDCIALGEQILGQIGAVLTGHAGDECRAPLGHGKSWRISTPPAALRKFELDTSNERNSPPDSLLSWREDGSRVTHLVTDFPIPHSLCRISHFAELFIFSELDLKQGDFLKRG